MAPTACRAVSDDIEVQSEEDFVKRLSDAAELNVPTSKRMMHLTLYFVFNISLTIYNKMILGKVSCRSLFPRVVWVNGFRVSIPVVAHCHPRRFRHGRVLCPAPSKSYQLLPVVQTARVATGRPFGIVHDKHCHIPRVAVSTPTLDFASQVK